MIIKVLPNDHPRWGKLAGHLFMTVAEFGKYPHQFPNGGYRIVKWFGDSGPYQDIPKEITQILKLQHPAKSTT